MLILIVGNDALFPSDVVHQMRQWGHRVESTAMGQDAIIRAQRIPFDLVLLDVLLPDVSGQVLIPQIKALQPETKIIAVAEYNTEQLEKDIRKLGISYYLTKPFPTEELKSILDHTQKALMKTSLRFDSAFLSEPRRQGVEGSDANEDKDRDGSLGTNEWKRS